MILGAIPEIAGYDTWEEDDSPTIPIPLLVRTSPVPLAEGLPLQPGIHLEYRDLMAACPWAFSVGMGCGAMGWPMLAGAVAGAAFGVVFDTVIRRHLEGSGTL